MANGLQDSPDFKRWWALFIKKNQLPPYTVAKLMADEFGGSLNTWRTRTETLFRVLQAPTQPNKDRYAEQERYFVEEILERDFPYVQPNHKYAKKITQQKLVCISDPHDPYSHPKVWSDVLGKHHDASHVHINGDVWDLYSRSRFPKMQGYESFYSEIRKTFDRLEWLSTHWKRVTIIKGNHDDRTEKRLAQLVNSDELWLTKQDLLTFVASFFDNIEIVGQRINHTDQDISVKFIWQCDDIVFTHIERSQKQSSGLLDTIKQQLQAWSGYLGLKPFRWIVQGHNHRLTFDHMGDCYGVLAPMAADVGGKGLQYIFSPKMSGKPPVIGYLVFWTENGITDYNKSRPYIIE